MSTARVTDLHVTSKQDWSFEALRKAWDEIEVIARDELGLVNGVDYYPPQFDVVSAEQMLDAYSSVGLPIYYPHWSFGKDFLRNKKRYDAGHMGLALEMVINTNPCVNFLMEENDLVSQVMVMAHAAVGHSAFFKSNVYYQQWTEAGSILDYMGYARDFVVRCEERYGLSEVELVLDAAHSLASHGIDKYPRTARQNLSEEARLRRLLEEDDARQRKLDVVLAATGPGGKPAPSTAPDADAHKEFEEQEENLLYYVMKRAPNLAGWKRELLRICHRINQYFLPQGLTKVGNEGFATFCHHYIMTRLEEKGVISSDAYISFLRLHSSVVYQAPYSANHYSGLNPYALGFNVLRDLKRVCEAPTDEDREWLPHVVGRPWQEVVKEAAFEYRDDSFIQQFMTPKVMRDMHLFAIRAERAPGARSSKAKVTEVSDPQGFAELRTALARSYERINYVPQIIVQGADLEGDRTLRLRYDPYENRGLDVDDAKLVLKYLDALWGYKVELTF
jgi:stage V sporulation protein R